MADDSLAVICGPTAAGKSALAMRLAESRPIAIISADSRQIYRGFDIGTAKPTPDEQRRVPHHGIDVADPTERYSAARWSVGAERWIADARARGQLPVIVGGTGFYLRSLVEPLFTEPPLDPGRRRRLQRVLADLTTDELRHWCRALDPPRAHLGSTQLRRAIEIALLTGISLSRWHRDAPGARRRAARYLLVDPGEPLRDRIEERIHEMLADGWVDEVRRLMRDVPEDAPAWNASGYRAVRLLVRGELARDEAIARAFIDTRQYAKRQRTWFRHQLPSDGVTRIDPRAADAEKQALRWLDDVTHETA